MENGGWSGMENGGRSGMENGGRSGMENDWLLVWTINTGEKAGMAE